MIHESDLSEELQKRGLLVTDPNNFDDATSLRAELERRGYVIADPNAASDAMLLRAELERRGYTIAAPDRIEDVALLRVELERQGYVVAAPDRMKDAALLRAELERRGYVVADSNAAPDAALLRAELERRGYTVAAPDRIADAALLRTELERRGYVVADPNAAPDAVPLRAELERRGCFVAANDTLDTEVVEPLRTLPPARAAAFANRYLLDVLAANHRSIFWGDRLCALDKAAAFLEDEKFRQAWDTIAGSYDYDQYNGPQGISWRLHVLCWAARRGLGLAGDFVECGVFRGDMSWVVAKTVNFAESGKRFFLYDTFAGFSPKYSSADDFPMNPNFYEYADAIYHQDGLYEGVVERFRPFGNVEVVRGVLPDTLADVCPDRIAYLHVDLNSPAAEIGVLEKLFDRVVPGAAVVFDDYGWLEYLAQREAEDAFMRERGYGILELPTGQGLVIR
ncbi:TylF/MycF/NovP-related O-methyltransferase [Desulfovibrio aminophilus]|uniref:TylF/MycF/NovP-related O-methyltransferase n=1 Tax=Desulfovibrio aminophilus TaxID=81425 RepID=UPI003392450B